MKELEKLEDERRGAEAAAVEMQEVGKRGRKKYESRNARLFRKGQQAMRCVLFDHQYFISAVDSCECDCLSEPVWKRESGGNCGAIAAFKPRIIFS